MKFVFVSKEDAKKLKDFRIHEWIDIDKMEVRYGVQARVMPRKWAHVCVGNSPFVAELRIDAEGFVAELRKGE